MVAFDIELLAVAFGRLCGGQHCIQQFIHTGIQIFHREGTVLHRLHQFSRGAESGCWHLEIGASLDSRHMIVRPAPVGDYKSVVIPVAAEYLFEKVHALIGVFAIDLIVGGHDCTGFRLVDRHFKSGQVDLPEGSLVYDRVHRHAAFLLRVDREVLDAGEYPLALDSLYIRCCHPACQIRVF